MLAADVRLGRFKLRYQGSAEVLENHVKSGEFVGAGAPAFTVADLDHPYVDIFVPQAQITALKVGMPMAAQIDAQPRPVHGTRGAHRTQDRVHAHAFSSARRSAPTW